MEIREATASDIPAIVTLLKLSLGESLMPKTEEYWRWKHLENPFGASPVLLCYEKGELIGVRAFMRWEWYDHKQIYRALRAVDTATHPNFQGKGIFKTLTLALIDLCAQKGDHLIFNTPNQQSKPGYLKMGWEEAGNLPVILGVERPVNMIWNGIFPVTRVEKKGAMVEKESIEYYLNHPKLGALLDSHHNRLNVIGTRSSRSYLNWRYVKVPVTKYVAIGDEYGGELRGLIFARMKQTRWGREMRITDFFWNGVGSGNELTMKLREIKKAWRIDYTTLSGTVQSPVRLFSGFSVKASIGPTVTLRSLQLTRLDSFLNFSHWSPSIGDLELF